ncbi:MAG TPA: LPS export ABC transporter periplasmic protein LptC [Gemmatimonadaceae bacterium]
MIRVLLCLTCAVLLGTLTACGDTQAPPVASQTLLPDSAEQMMFGIELMLTDAGVRRASVKSDTLLMYDDATREELRKVIARFFTTAGEQEAVLTSDQGTHSSRLGTMEARGNVLVISSEGKRLESPHLKYDPTRNEISSDSAFTLTEGERVTKGVGFVSNPDMTNMRILAGAQMTGQQVKIPRR